jgi:hypothetical protein
VPCFLNGSIVAFTRVEIKKNPPGAMRPGDGIF